MKIPHSTFIKHEPFAKPYRGKRKRATLDYDKAVISATKNWPKITKECQLRVTFVLGPSKFANPKYLGPDLDNLLKRLVDDLKDTVFQNPDSDDSFIVSMEATKTKVENDAAMGVHIEIIPMHTIRK